MTDKKRNPFTNSISHSLHFKNLDPSRTVDSITQTELITNKTSKIILNYIKLG